MQSCDTNILLYYLDESCSAYPKAKDYIESVWHNKDFVICDLVLLELYVLLRNPKVFESPLMANEAAEVCQSFRSNPNWQVLETMEGVMPIIWDKFAPSISSRWAVFDLRLGLTLKNAGVKVFATRNIKDFKEIGFYKLINPIDPTSLPEFI